MAEGMPHGELLCRALEWLLSEKSHCPDKSWRTLLDDAGMRFNLTPKDDQSLHNLLEEKKKEIHAL
ncbi:MAG: hypothetical protein LBV76_00915 [Deltaproteobacteria bacterium]|nr:hypothetical protein [Deltaproteobacteria bacterium]